MSQKHPGFGAAQTPQVRPQNNDETNNNRRDAPAYTNENTEKHREIKEPELWKSESPPSEFAPQQDTDHPRHAQITIQFRNESRHT